MFTKIWTRTCIFASCYTYLVLCFVSTGLICRMGIANFSFELKDYIKQILLRFPYFYDTFNISRLLFALTCKTVQSQVLDSVLDCTELVKYFLFPWIPATILFDWTSTGCRRLAIIEMHLNSKLIGWSSGYLQGQFCEE